MNRKLNICQVLKCKKLESPDHVNTYCKKHAEQLEKWQKQRGYQYSPYEHKEINEKNNVWSNGVETVRGIRVSQLNIWIKMKEEKKKTLEAMIELINEQIKDIDKKIADDKRTKNARWHK